MSLRHVCFSRTLACSGSNPCRICFKVVIDNALFPALQYFMADAMFAARMNQEQANVLMDHIYRSLPGALETSLNSLHERMQADPEVNANALDLSRVMIMPETVLAPVAQTVPAPVPEALPAFAKDGYPELRGPLATPDASVNANADANTNANANANVADVTAASPEPQVLGRVAMPSAARAAAPALVPTPAPAPAPAPAPTPVVVPPGAPFDPAALGLPPFDPRSLDPRIMELLAQYVPDPAQLTALQDPRVLASLLSQLSAIGAPGVGAGSAAARLLREDADADDGYDEDDYEEEELSPPPPPPPPPRRSARRAARAAASDGFVSGVELTADDIAAAGVPVAAVEPPPVPMTMPLNGTPTPRSGTT